MKPVGYLVNNSDVLEGERGLIYDYIIAGNGLFIEAHGAWLKARIPIGECDIRGLAPLEQEIELRFGKIPEEYFSLALNEIMKDPHREMYAAITHNGGYHVIIPAQEDKPAHVRYNNPDNIVVDLHSHGHIGAFFSPEDNRDDQGFRISAVLGMMDRSPVLLMRVGIYGYFSYVNWQDVFTGKPPVVDVTDMAIFLDESQEKEVRPVIDLQNKTMGRDDLSEFLHHRMWWHWELGS